MSTPRVWFWNNYSRGVCIGSSECISTGPGMAKRARRGQIRWDKLGTGVGKLKSRVPTPYDLRFYRRA